LHSTSLAWNPGIRLQSEPKRAVGKETARVLPAPLRNVLSALWCVKKCTWKTFYSLWFLQDSFSEICRVIHKCVLTHYIMSRLFCGLWRDLSSPSFSMSCLISPLLPKSSHSNSQWYCCLKSCPMRFHFFWALFLPLCCPYLQPSMALTGRETTVDHKMVDQSLFPAHPNWRWPGAQLGCWFDPTFDSKHC